MNYTKQWRREGERERETGWVLTKAFGNLMVDLLNVSQRVGVCKLVCMPAACSSQTGRRSTGLRTSFGACRTGAWQFSGCTNSSAQKTEL